MERQLRGGKAMSALKELAELEYQARYQDKPDFPENARFKRRYSDRTANGLAKAIIDWIRLNGGHAERINTMGRPIDRTKVTTNTLGQRQRIGSVEWIPGGGQRGSADISATIYGKSVKIEIKMKDRQSPEQREYQQQIEAAGGEYWLVRSFAEFLEFYNKIKE
jgi:hypothetical protein